VAGNALPVAILFVYIAASLTDVYNDWISANYMYVVLLLSGITAATSMQETRLNPAGGSSPASEGTNVITANRE